MQNLQKKHAMIEADVIARAVSTVDKTLNNVIAPTDWYWLVCDAN